MIKSRLFTTKILIQQTLALLVSVFFSIQVLAATEFEIITLQHRFAQDLLPTVQQIVGQNGTVTGIQNQLIVRTSSENMAIIKQLVAQLDKPRKNFKITISQSEISQRNQDSIGTSGRARVGKVTVTHGNLSPKVSNGIVVDLQQQGNSVKSTGQQFINVADGERGLITVGTMIPYTQEWITLTQQYATTYKSTEFITISTGFTVLANSVGNQVELKITPSIRKANSPQREIENPSFNFEELSSTVRINPGEWMDLGGVMQQTDAISHAILNQQNAHQSSYRQWLIRVD